MAARFRFETLPQSAKDQFNKLFSSWDARSQDILKDLVDKGDTEGLSSYLTPRIKAQNPQVLQSTLDQVSNIVSQLPSQSDAYKKFIGTNVNEANLTDEELQDRITAFKNVGQTKGTIDRASIERELDPALEAAGVGTVNHQPAIVKYLTDFVMGNQRMPTAQEFWTDYRKTGPNPIKSYNPYPIENFLTNGTVHDRFANLISSQITSPETAQDVSRINDILSSRDTQRKNENILQDYIKGLPDALAGPENEFIRSLQSQGKQQFQDVLAPQALESINARGGLFSGAVGDVLSSAAGNIQGNIESIQQQLDAENNKFYFNAAYQNALRKQLVGQTDYQTFLAGERSRVLGEQKNAFVTAQTKLDNQNINDNLARQYQQQLIAQQRQYQMRQDFEKQQRTAGLIGGIGQTVGGIAGSYFGPVGTIAGSYLGGQVGSMFGSSGGYQPSNYPIIPQAGGRQ